MLADSEVKGSGIVRAAEWGTTQFAQWILDEQGYIILGCDDAEALEGGLFTVHDSVFGIEPAELGPLVIVGFASRKGFQRQIGRYYPWRVKPQNASRWDRYVKVIAE